MQLIPSSVNIDFVGKRKIFAIFSVVVVSISVALFVIVGPNWGIDFTGGSEIHIKFEETVGIGDVRSAMEHVGLPADAVQAIGDPEDGEYVIRVQNAAFGSDEVRAEVKDRLAASFGSTWLAEERFDAEVGARMTIEYTGEVVPLDQIRAVLVGVKGIEVQEASDDSVFYVKLPGLASKVEQAIGQSLSDKPFETLQIDSVGPKVGGELRRQGFISVFATLALVLVYVAFRFDMAFAPGAVVCLFHDVSIVIGVFVILQREINVSFIGALLTIVGYSLNDTIVVYDRIRENMERYRRKELPALINTSINETLNRTVNTSLTTVLAMIVFMFMGGPVIEDFALAIILGVFVGTYSSVYVASPIILVMQDVKPWLFKLMTRSQRSSPEQAAGAEHAEGGSGRHGELAQKDGKPRTEREMFRDL